MKSNIPSQFKNLFSLRFEDEILEKRFETQKYSFRKHLIAQLVVLLSIIANFLLCFNQTSPKEDQTNSKVKNITNANYSHEISQSQKLM